MAEEPLNKNTIPAFLARQVLTSLLIVALALAAGLAVNRARPDRFDPFVDWRAMEVEAGYRRLPAGVLGVKFEEMVKLYRRSDVWLADTRPADFYSLGHIPGAKSVPLSEAEKVLPGLLEKMPRAQLVVVYCDGSACPDSFRLARLMTARGLRRVAVYLGGIEEWEGRGMPIVRVTGG